MIYVVLDADTGRVVRFGDVQSREQARVQASGDRETVVVVEGAMQRQSLYVAALDAGEDA